MTIRNYKYTKISRNSKAEKIILTQYFKVIISSKFKTFIISRKGKTECLKTAIIGYASTQLNEYREPPLAPAQNFSLGRPEAF